MQITRPNYACLRDFPAFMAERGFPRWVTISDDRVTPLVRPRLNETHPWLTFPAGESSKTLATACRLLEDVSRLDVDRQTVLVAIGGGVVGDVAGFVAATYLRGLRLVQVPTTLVAMVDSSIGGKVGVDMTTGKNLVGAFHPASDIFVDPETLRTLPAREWSGGMAEVVKHGLLDGEEHLAWLETLPPDHASWPSELLQQLLRRSADVKLQVVDQDPYEQSVRAHLNLGHTLGHALETCSNYQLLTHGEAVSIGLLAALRLSGAGQLESRIAALLERWGLPTRVPPSFQWDAVASALRKDKKNREGQVRFVLLPAPGQARVEAVSLEQVRPVFEALKGE